MHFLPFCVDLNISHYYDQYCIRRAMYKYSYRLCFNSLGDFAVELCKWQAARKPPHSINCVDAEPSARLGYN